MDSPTINLLFMLRERTETLLAAGNIEEAYHAVSAAVEKAQQTLSPEHESINIFVDLLEMRGEIARSLGKYEQARDDYRQAIDQLDHSANHGAQIGRLHAALGAAHDALGNAERAAAMWAQAIGYFERHEPPLLLDVAALANNLGFIKKALGDLDSAETNFLRSLEILHREYGSEHEETAAVSNNLGALYQASGYFEQAREMHMMALEARRKLLGEEHADTAQSHNNLALALLDTGDRAWARRHFEKSLASFESLGRDYAEDLDAVASNYCEFLRSEGESALADTIAGRVAEQLNSFH